jgi:hypothetical protein
MAPERSTSERFASAALEEPGAPTAGPRTWLRDRRAQRPAG